MKKLKSISFISTLSMIILLASCSTGKHFDIFGSSAENKDSSSYNQHSGSGQSTSSKQNDSSESNQDSGSSTSSSSTYYEDPLGIAPSFSEDGKTVTYGLYPQKNVNDSSLLSALNALDDSAKGSNGWYLYDDAYYAKLNASPCNSSHVFDNGTTIKNGTTYWFKCEPITWDIMQNDGGEYYLLSSVLLDAHCYYTSDSDRTINGKTIYSNNYEYSSIREWLNGDFYDTAFALGDSCIQTTTVDNSASTTVSSSNPYACNNTEDKVFLPSYQDYLKFGYEYWTEKSKIVNVRKNTDWARARGALAFSHPSLSSSLYGSYYWTRSPSLSGGASTVMDIEFLYSDKVDITHSCVRPAITLKIS